MLDLIQTICTQHSMSVLLASHILVDVERTCENILIMHKGRLLKEGKVGDLRGRYSGTYSVRVEGDRNSFERVLKKRGCVLQPDGEHLLDVTLPRGKRTQVILEAARETRISLRRLVPGIQDLEDVFVKLIGEKSDAHL